MDWEGSRALAVPRSTRRTRAKRNWFPWLRSCVPVPPPLGGPPVVLCHDLGPVDGHINGDVFPAIPVRRSQDERAREGFRRGGGHLGYGGGRKGGGRYGCHSRGFGYLGRDTPSAAGQKGGEDEGGYQKEQKPWNHSNESLRLRQIPFVIVLPHQSLPSLSGDRAILMDLIRK